MKKFEAKLETKMKALLGEGPLWHPQKNRLYFVDIVNHKVQSFDPFTAQKSEWKLPSYVGAIAQGSQNELFVAVQNQLMLLNTDSGLVKSMLRFDLAEDIRFNECKCDSRGRFWMGTMHLEAKKGGGAFYRVDLDGSVTKVLSHLSIPNGFCWSKDNRYLYHIDSLDQTVRRFDFEDEAGKIDNPIVVLDFSSGNGLPDGMCMDAEGMLWIAFWGGGRVCCFNPVNGEQLAEVKVPALHVTSCVFGGNELETLYITTARLGLSDQRLKEYPLSGSVFSCDVGVKGINMFKCRIEI